MTLKKPKAAKRLLVSLSPERSFIRSQLRKASRGNVFAFTQAVGSYTNLITAYLYLSGVQDPIRRRQETERILIDCWRYLPYTRRVSDFERFLQVQLERSVGNSSLRIGEPHSALSSLNHIERFLLVARIFEKWNSKSLKLTLRWSKNEVVDALAKLKCKLAGFRLALLKPDEIAQVYRVNQLLEGEFSDKTARKVEKELAGQYHAHQFKVDWLTYRCELADLRSDMLFSQGEYAEMMEDVSLKLRSQPMEQPSFADLLINQISFIRLP